MSNTSGENNRSVYKKTIGELSADAKSFSIPYYSRGSHNSQNSVIRQTTTFVPSRRQRGHAWPRRFVKKSFFIPSYQRGYRWGEREVEQLFDDLWEAMDKKKAYCLQPLVVMKKGHQWRVIDGQQRLTTLYILLKVLGQEPGFSLEYETRPKSEEFLANIVKKNEENFKRQYGISPTEYILAQQAAKSSKGKQS